MRDELSVLRACHRVLKPAGRVAGYTIHVPPDLGEAERTRAVELGPGEVLSDAPAASLLAEAGLELVVEEDVTEAFAQTCAALLGALNRLEGELRAEVGDEAFEEERAKKAGMLQGIGEGLLRRALLVAVRPGRGGRARAT